MSALSQASAGSILQRFSVKYFSTGFVLGAVLVCFGLQSPPRAWAGMMGSAVEFTLAQQQPSPRSALSGNQSGVEHVSSLAVASGGSSAMSSSASLPLSEKSSADVASKGWWDMLLSMLARLLGRAGPTVYIADRHGGADKDFEIDELWKYRSRVGDRNAAQFELQCCLTLRNVDVFANLPQRPPTRPYLIWSHGIACLPNMTWWKRIARCRKIDELALRKDFLFVNFDLRDPWLKENQHPPLPGVTMAPPKYYNGPSYDVDSTPAFFVTFRGQVRDGYYNSAHVRSDLQAAFAAYGDRQDVFVEFLSVGHKYTDEDKERYSALMDTAYALVPHGDGRWNYRFSEVVGACAIPVVIADGITWPFAELINWSEAAVWVSEDFSRTFDPGSSTHRRLAEARKNETVNATPSSRFSTWDLLRHLPRQPEVIRRMRRRVCEINRKYFSTPEKRWLALLRSAVVRVGRPA